MWTIFKLLNLFSVLVSAYIWFTSTLPMVPLLVVLNAAMIGCFVALPVQFRIDARSGWILFAMIALISWTLWNESAGMGMMMVLQYAPVLYLISLPRDYQAELLRFVTKWVAIPLIPSLLMYWATLFIDLPGFGRFVHPGYEPYINYIFYIKTTFDYGMFVRFNGFFPEPGHLSMVCVFLMMANRFDFKSNRWLWVLLTAVMFSFSLAGYILTLLGFSLLKINSVAKAVSLGVLLTAFIVGVINFSGGDNALNQLIIERLKYDESKGIEGNNRYFNNTEYEFDKSLKNGEYWTGVSKRANMELISGSGFKRYTLEHGLIGIILVFILYLTLIPPRPDWHYSLSFLFIIMLCFAQNAYPGWYAWLFPYVLGLDLNSKRQPATEYDEEDRSIN